MYNAVHQHIFFTFKKITDLSQDFEYVSVCGIL